MARSGAIACLSATGLALSLASAGAADPVPAPIVVPTGAPEVVFDPKRDACDGHDVPDVPPRLYRDASGTIRMFTLHFENRAIKTPDLAKLKVDCRIVFRGSGSGEPAAYDDRSWIAATWTGDGKTIHGLIHHEYQGNTHPGRCASKVYIECWFNTVLAVRSNDGGETFAKTAKPVVASAPFRQDVGQGRHRGFFNPSNIVTDGVWHYMIAATTGWEGQAGGACLFRTENIADPTKWRAYDGIGFETGFVDPYRQKPDPKKTCMPVGPFPAPVGSITRHRGTGRWIAVFQASAGGAFPTSGIYAAASPDLKVWSAPVRILAAKTLYDDPCGAGALLSYPVLIDREATTRNFEDTGDTPDLYLSRLRVEGCSHTSDRTLVRQKVRIGF